MDGSRIEEFFCVDLSVTKTVRVLSNYFAKLCGLLEFGPCLRTAGSASHTASSSASGVAWPRHPKTL